MGCGRWVISFVQRERGAGFALRLPSVSPRRRVRGGAQRGLGWQQLSSVSFPCLHKCVNDYLFIFGWLDCSLNNIFPEEGDLNILQHLGRRVLPDERVAAPREETLNSGLMARDVETLRYSQSLSYRYLSFYIDIFLDKPLLLR